MYKMGKIITFFPQRDVCNWGIICIKHIKTLAQKPTPGSYTINTTSIIAVSVNM